MGRPLSAKMRKLFLYFEANLPELRSFFLDRGGTDEMLAYELRKTTGEPYTSCEICRARHRYGIVKRGKEVKREGDDPQQNESKETGAAAGSSLPMGGRPAKNLTKTQKLAIQTYLRLGVEESEIQPILHTDSHTIKVRDKYVIVRRINRSENPAHPYRTFVKDFLSGLNHFLHCILCEGERVIAHFFIPTSEVDVQSISFRLLPDGTPSGRSRWTPFYNNFSPLIEDPLAILERRMAMQEENDMQKENDVQKENNNDAKREEEIEG